MRIALIALTGALGLAGPAMAQDVLLYQLPGNPSTGYHWMVNETASTGLDIVMIEDMGYGPPESDLIGAPAPARFDLRCTGLGDARLIFDYVSPDGSTVDESRVLTLTCAEAE